MEEIVSGALYVVSTPIGNLADISYRAVHILKNVDMIAAEDTRTSGVLLRHYAINTPMRSYHSYNLKRETPRLIDMLLKGRTLALISDAGTPGISDPGYQLIRDAVANKIRVIPIPGASALLGALVASGLTIDKFVFEGFLPVKKGRKTRIEFLKDETRTVVFYEAPHRIEKTVFEIFSAWGDRKCVLGRELTKKFEEFFYGTLSELLEHISKKNIKGELVLLIEGKEPLRKERKMKYERR